MLAWMLDVQLHRIRLCATTSCTYTLTLVGLNEFDQEGLEEPHEFVVHPQTVPLPTLEEISAVHATVAPALSTPGCHQLLS